MGNAVCSKCFHFLNKKGDIMKKSIGIIFVILVFSIYTSTMVYGASCFVYEYAELKTMDFNALSSTVDDYCTTIYDYEIALMNGLLGGQRNSAYYRRQLSNCETQVKRVLRLMNETDEMKNQFLEYVFDQDKCYRQEQRQ